MVEEVAEIVGIKGLHAENASHFVSFTGRYTGSIRFVKDDTVSNAKSILNVLSLGLNSGERIKIRVDGPDERKEIKEILEYLRTMP